MTGPTGNMMDNSGFDAIFGGTRLMAILRGMGAERSLALSTTAWNLGIDVVELPIQTPDDVEALRVVAAAGRTRGKAVGAGTVVSAEHVAQALSAGATFTVSPGLDLDVVRASHEAGMLSLPGVATASEVQSATSAGLTWLKAFPASVLGPQWLTAMNGPFPQARFVTTGGMNAVNAAEYLDAGAHVVAVGSALEDPAQLPQLAALLGAGARR
ncbi:MULTISPECIES: bifunctional 4-hydroxy-2-oxoglutarate aldolase/2-dehydro-3-deoxy-phosphogluconate aldolase [Microbacterium]|nr:bifunctional 4-hydroxy-2-oxoglutarate aldolase/2-dehydro-3-deoxy-phosphogluconate aldolase [Microbacterium liquefaciens]